MNDEDRERLEELEREAAYKGANAEELQDYRNAAGTPPNKGLLYNLRHPLEALNNKVGNIINQRKLRKWKKKSKIRRLIEKLSLALRIAIAIIVILLILIVVVIIAIGDYSARSGVNTRAKGVEKLNITKDSPQTSQLALELYNKYDSLIGFNTQDLKNLYDTFIEDNSNNNRYLKSSGTKEFGSDSGEKYSLDQKLSLYQHIQRTEKYNFNKIKWKEYTHITDGIDIETELKEDLEIYVPKSSDEETISTLLKTTAPYLLTQDIPLGLLSGMVAESGGASSVEATTSEKFVYEVLKESLSKMTINKYVLQSIKLKSYYDEYDKNTYNQTYYVYRYSNGFETFISEDAPILDTNVTESVTTEEIKIDGTESYNSETFWYVAEAITYDRLIENTFNHIRYSEDEVNILKNPDNNTLVEKQTINELDHVVTAKNINSSPGMPPPDENGNYETPTRISKTYTYVQKEGTKYIYEKEWKDKLSSSKSESKEYTYDTALEYNTKTNENYPNISSDKTTMSEDEFKKKFPCGSSIFDRYTKEDTVLKLYGMSMIDLIDSNSGTYGKYLVRSSSNGSNEGLSRNKLKSAYNQVKNVLNSLVNKEKNENGEIKMEFNSYTTGYAAGGALPFVYGSSLGYKNTSMSIATTSNYISASNLLKEYLRACEGIGYETDPPSTKIVEQGEEKFYRVAKNGTVGYGVDLSQNPQWKSELEGQINATIIFGETLIPVDLVDAIEDRFMNEQLEKVESKWPDLKMYQKHALVVRMYNWPDISGFGNYYPSTYNEVTDDLFETVSDEFKDNPTATNLIKDKARKDSVLYTNYMSTPNKGDNGAVSLEGRRFSEWCVFSLGYYDKLQRFYTEGGSTPVGDLVDANGVINQEKVNELQLWYEDNIFGGAFHGGSNGGDFKLDNNCKWYSAITESYAKQVHPSQNGVVGGEYFDYDRTLSDYKAVGKYSELGMFQCTWWSNARQAQYLTEMGYQGEIKFSTGDGRYTASGFHDAYNIPLNTDYMQIRPHSVVSEDGGGNGHTYFCEAVGTNEQGHKCIVISHCGSGHNWHGVDVIDLESGHPYMYYKISGSVCLDDLL